MLMYSSENSTLEWTGSIVQTGRVAVVVTVSLSVEHDHTAGDLPAGEIAEALVDVGQRIGPAHQLVHLEPAFHVEVDEPREVDVGPYRTIHRAADALLLEGHHVRSDGRPHVHGGHAHDDRGAARADGVDD